MKNAVAPPPIPKCQLPWLVRLALKLCLLMIHTLFIIYQSGSHLMQAVESYIISLGLLKNYRNFQLRNLKHLAIVVDSEEARNTKKVKELLLWLPKNGINYVALYDMEGVLKKSLGGDLGSFANCMTSTSQQNGMIIELLSFADSKAGIAKAANFLCSKYHNDGPTSSSKKETAITESEIDDALDAVGCGGPDPDLLLIYGPVRCHLGFPAWRIRYTEIIHMGSLKSIKYGAILKAFYEYSKKQQNYGT